MKTNSSANIDPRMVAFAQALESSVGDTAKTIIGDIQLAASETMSYPLLAIQVVKPPIKITVIIQLELLGITSVNLGISRFVGTPTAVADTVIMAPARKQNNIPLATL